MVSSTTAVAESVTRYSVGRYSETLAADPIRADALAEQLRGLGQGVAVAETSDAGGGLDRGLDEVADEIDHLRDLLDGR